MRMSEVKHTLDGFKGRLNSAEEKIGEFEDILVESVQHGTQGRKRLKKRKKDQNRNMYKLESPKKRKVERQKTYLKK